MEEVASSSSSPGSVGYKFHVHRAYVYSGPFTRLLGSLHSGPFEVLCIWLGTKIMLKKLIRYI